MIDVILNPTIGDIRSQTIVNTFSALSLPPYWRAMNYLADNLASFDIDVVHNELETDESHYLDSYFSRMANPTQTSHEVFRTWYFHGEHYGNGFAYVRRIALGSSSIQGIYNLLPEEVTPYKLIPDNGSIWDATIWYYHAPSKTAISSADVLHYKPHVSFDGFVGFSTAQLMARTFRGAQSLQNYAAQYVEKGTMVRGAIQLPAGTSKETAAEIIETLKKFRGATGDRDVLVLSGGATLNNATLSASDSRIIEQEQEYTKKIAQITGVDPLYLFEKSESKYNGDAEQIGMDQVRYTFRTRIEGIENELTCKLLSEAEQDQGYSIELDADALLRGNAKTEADIANQTVAGGLRTKNEGRELLGLPADPTTESDTLLTPTAVASMPKANDTQPSEELESIQSTDLYDALQPLIEDASARIETKSDKAIENAVGKTGQERIAWGNVFADLQAKYAAQAFQPIAKSLNAITGKSLDLGKLAEAYAGEIKRRVAGEEPRKLFELVGGFISERTN